MTRCRILSALSTSRGPPSGAAVFELHRVVVPSCSGAAAVPRTQAPRHRPPRTSRSHRPLDARQSSGRLSRGSGIIGISGTSLRDWKCRRHGAKIVPFRQQIPHGSSSWWPDTPIYLHPPKAQDAALSRLKHGFESRRERQGNQALRILRRTASPTRLQYRWRSAPRRCLRTSFIAATGRRLRWAISSCWPSNPGRSSNALASIQGRWFATPCGIWLSRISSRQESIFRP
jgi:hypothetical protein